MLDILRTINFKKQNNYYNIIFILVPPRFLRPPIIPSKTLRSCWYATWLRIRIHTSGILEYLYTQASDSEREFMNFAVIGGAGLIGSHIVKRLVSDGHDVTVMDDLSRGSMANLEGVRDRIDFVNIGIRERDGLKRVL